MLGSTLPPAKSHSEGGTLMLFRSPPDQTPPIRAMTAHLAAQNSTQQPLMGHSLHPGQGNWRVARDGAKGRSRCCHLARKLTAAD